MFMKKMAKSAYHSLLKISPTLYFNIKYSLAAKRLCDKKSDRKPFEEFLENCADQDKKCMQIGVKEYMGAKFGPNWVSVDKYDTRPFIDYHYDVQDLKFEDATFDAVACISILEHIPYPQKAISEFYRVLKPGGKIWIQLPFQYPYHEAPKDYWRVSPDGLRVWMSDFKEITCGNFQWTRSSLASSSYYYVMK